MRMGESKIIGDTLHVGAKDGGVWVYKKGATYPVVPGTSTAGNINRTATVVGFVEIEYMGVQVTYTLNDARTSGSPRMMGTKQFVLNYRGDKIAPEPTEKPQKSILKDSIIEALVETVANLEKRVKILEAKK